MTSILMPGFFASKAEATLSQYCFVLGPSFGS